MYNLYKMIFVLDVFIDICIRTKDVFIVDNAESFWLGGIQITFLI